MKLRKILKFLRKNYFLPILFAVILFVGLISIYKMAFSKPHYVYVKVEVGQGLWWANTQRPSIWQLNAINKGDASYDLMGNLEAEIVNKKYYRYYGSDQYDIYLVMKLKAGFNKRTKQYSFNRSAISIGAPIEIQFSKGQVTGTVIAINEKPFVEKLTAKTVHLSKRGAWPWELEAIRPGDGYFDGEDKIFEILDKSSLEVTNLTWDVYGNSTPDITEPSKYITVKAKVKLKQVNNQWILGEDQLVTPGRNLSISTPNFVFENYIVSKIE